MELIGELGAIPHKAQAIGYNPEIILAARWVQPIAR